jgi:hypothetical protein
MWKRIAIEKCTWFMQSNYRIFKAEQACIFVLLDCRKIFEYMYSEKKKSSVISFYVLELFMLHVSNITLRYRYSFARQGFS